MDPNQASTTRVMTVLSFLALISILLGIAAYVLNVEQNRCEMTYMYEMPEYIPVPLTSEKTSKEDSSSANIHHARYRLFVYGEGIYGEQLKSELRYNKLNGVPVLFVPGSGGSYAQVRSLASILLRKSESLRSKVQFNVFSVDFGADFSALDGALLAKQSDFVVRCLRRISHLYPQRTLDGNGAGIIVYGHSMGGVVALMAAKTLANRGHPDTMSPLLLTFASPFARPVIYVDPHLGQIYDNLLDEIPKNLFLLSVGGGFRDHLVPSHLTVATNDTSRALMVNTMAMPLTWASTDHKCIVWCRQVVLATARTLFELVDAETRRMTNDMTKMSTTLRKHFAAQNQLPYLPKLFGESSIKAAGATTNKATKGSASVSGGKGHSVKVDLPQHGDSNLRLFALHNWPGQVQIKTGDSAFIEPESSLLLPPLYSNKRLATFRFDGNKLSNQDVELIFHPTKNVKSTHKLAWINEWMADSTSSVYYVQFPTIGTALKSFFAPTTIASDLKQRLLAQIIFNDFDSPYNAAVLRLIPKECSSPASTSINGSLAIFHNTDYTDEVYEFAPTGQPISLTIRKQAAVPLSNTSLSHVLLLFDPSCAYDIEIKWSLPDVSSQYVRFCAHLFPTSLGLVLIAFLLATVRTLDEPASTNLMSFIFFHCKPVSLIAMSKLIHMMVRRWAHLLPVAFDFDVIEAADGENVMFSLMPIILFFFALGFFGVYAQLLSLVFCTFSRPFARIASWLLRPSLYIAVVLQTAGLVAAALFSSALGIGVVYLSFLMPLLCFSSSGINWQLQRHVMSLAFFSLWLALVAGPTFLHHFFLPASNGFDPRQYRPVFAAVDGSSRFDFWLLPGAICLSVGSIFFTIVIIRRLKQRQEEQTETSTVKTGSSNTAAKILQLGAIGTCLFASRTLYRAPTIAGVAFLLAAICHFLLSLRSKGKKDENGHAKTE